MLDDDGDDDSWRRMWKEGGVFNGYCKGLQERDGCVLNDITLFGTCCNISQIRRNVNTAYFGRPFKRNFKYHFALRKSTSLPGLDGTFIVTVDCFVLSFSFPLAWQSI